MESLEKATILIGEAITACGIFKSNIELAQHQQRSFTEDELQTMLDVAVSYVELVKTTLSDSYKPAEMLAIALRVSHEMLTELGIPRYNAEGEKLSLHQRGELYQKKEASK